MLVASLLLNLCFAAVAGYVLYRKGGLRYLRNYRAILRGDGLTIDNFPAYYRQRYSMFWADPIMPGRVVLAGDSLTEQHDWSVACGQTAMNRGIAGDTSVGLLFRVGEILRHRPRKLFLLIGVSDLRIGRSGKQILDTYAQSLLRRIRKDAPGTEVFVQSVLPINPQLFGSEIDPEEVSRLNQGLIQLARSHGATFADVHHSLLTGRALDPRYTTDGVHLNAQGYQVWEAELKRAWAATDLSIQDGRVPGAAAGRLSTGLLSAATETGMGEVGPGRPAPGRDPPGPAQPPHVDARRAEDEQEHQDLGALPEGGADVAVNQRIGAGQGDREYQQRRRFREPPSGPRKGVRAGWPGNRNHQSMVSGRGQQGPQRDHLPGERGPQQVGDADGQIGQRVAGG